MFTGIVEEMGTVVSMAEEAEILLWNGEKGPGWVLQVSVTVVQEGAYIGCSIAANGTCLTVTSIDGDKLTFGVAPETLRRTNLGLLKPGDKVNMERSMGVNDRNSGHFVQGHVDGTGRILSFQPENDSLWVKIATPKHILKSIIPKGYIAIDGTSLTVCEVNHLEGWFTIMLVAHTQVNVVLPLKKPGDLVNLEPDVLGKYAAASTMGMQERLDHVERQMQYHANITSAVMVIATALVLLWAVK